MPLATWGFGTGATGGTAHPFSLRIQGVEVIDSVPIESVTVNQSLSGNATLTFTIYDAAGTMAIPDGWADVEFVDHGSAGTSRAAAFDDGAFEVEFDETDDAAPATESVWVFGGLVMGTTVRQGAVAARYIDVRAVDYGFVLDRAPALADSTWSLAGTYSLYVAIQWIAGQIPLGGITATKTTYGTDDGRLVVLARDGTTANWYPARNASALNGQADLARGTTARSAMELACRESVIRDTTEQEWLGHGANVWVDPLKRLCLQFAGAYFDTLTTEIRQNPTTADHVAASDVAVQRDASDVESGTYVEDSNGGALTGWVGGTINGYSSMPSSVAVYSTGTLSQDQAASFQLDPYAGDATTFTCTVTTEAHFPIGYRVLVYYPGVGADGYYVVVSARLSFVGAIKQWDLVLNEIPDMATVRRSRPYRGMPTVARFNRTRFARAGILR